MHVSDIFRNYYFYCNVNVSYKLLYALFQSIPIWPFSVCFFLGQRYCHVGVNGWKENLSSKYMRQEVHSLHNNTNRKVYFKYHSPSLLPVKHFASLNVPTCLNMLHLTCRYIRDNQKYAFRLHCLFFYHDLTVSLLFLNCLTLIIKVLLTYHFTAHGNEKLVLISRHYPPKTYQYVLSFWHADVIINYWYKLPV